MYNVSDVSVNALCCGCGSCEAICPTQAINMAENYSGFLIPNIDKNKCVQCGKCRKVCPSVKENYNLLRGICDMYTDSIDKKEDIYGYIGHATNDTIRQEGQSGGVVTALLLYLYDNKKIKNAVVNRYNSNLIRNEVVLAKSREDILKASGSYYVQSSVLSKLGDNPDIAAVMVGCQAEAVKLREIAGITKPKYVIGLFCGYQCSSNFIKYIVQKADIPQNENIECFRFRYSHRDYGGWPGDIYIKTNKNEYLLNKTMRLNHVSTYTAFRCHLCKNHINYFSDLVCGDPWGITGDHRCGDTAVIALTKAGKELIESAVKDGYIYVNSVDPHLIMSQDGAYTRDMINAELANLICQQQRWENLSYSKIDNIEKIKHYLTLKYHNLKKRMEYTRKYFLASNEAVAFQIAKKQNFYADIKLKIRRFLSCAKRLIFRYQISYTQVFH